MQEIYSKDSVKIFYYQAKSNKYLITFNFAQHEHDVIIPNFTDIKPWGDGIYNQKLGINEINVVSYCLNYFHTEDLDEQIRVIKSYLPKDAIVLCIGQSMGSHGAILYASKLGCDFYAFGPGYKNLPENIIKKFKKSINNENYTEEQRNKAKLIYDDFNNCSIVPNRDYSNSAVFYDPYSGDEKDASIIKEIFKCKAVELPFGQHSAICYVNKHIRLTSIAQDYFENKKIINFCSSDENFVIKKKTLKVAVVGSSNAVLKNGYANELLKNSNNKVSYENFSIGDTVSIIPISTIIKNDIVNKYDLCIIDNPLNDLLYLEKSHISIYEIISYIYSLLHLFNNTTCKLLFIIHKAYHLDYFLNPVIQLLKHFKESVSIIDMSTLGTLNSFDSMYIDYGHYNDEFQNKLAKIVRLNIDNYDLMPYCHFDDSYDINFTLLSNFDKFKKDFNFKKSTRLVETNNLVLKEKESIHINSDDVGINHDELFIVAIKYWNSSDLNTVTFTTDIQKKTFLLSKKFKEILSGVHLNIKFKNHVTLSVNNFTLDQIDYKVHNSKFKETLPTKSELILTDIMFSDTDMVTLGKELVEKYNIVSYFNLLKKIVEKDKIDFNLNNFDMYNSIYFIKTYLKRLKNNVHKILFLNKCLLNNNAYKSVIFQMIGDIYYEDERFKSALDAYNKTLEFNDGFNKNEILLKLLVIHVFKIPNLEQAYEICKILELSEMHEHWQFCRCAFIIYRERKDYISALFYGKKMCEKKQNEKWTEDLKNLCSSYLLHNDCIN